jgi:hypothetical protein
MSVLRYIAVQTNGRFDELCRIMETETEIWGETYIGGQWIEEPSVISRYIREPGPDEFFHDEQRAQELMRILDEQNKLQGDVLRYIAVQNNGQVDELCRIIKTEIGRWGESYVQGRWVKDSSVMSKYMVEAGSVEFFHDEARALLLMKLLDSRDKTEQTEK